jgi:ankyrin repeat protein
MLVIGLIIYDDLTPLSWAIAPAAGESIMKLLLTKGANIHIKDSNDKTPLHHAANNKNQRMPVTINS